MTGSARGVAGGVGGGGGGGSGLGGGASPSRQVPSTVPRASSTRTDQLAPGSTRVPDHARQRVEPMSNPRRKISTSSRSHTCWMRRPFRPTSSVKKEIVAPPSGTRSRRSTGSRSRTAVVNAQRATAGSCARAGRASVRHIATKRGRGYFPKIIRRKIPPSPFRLIAPPPSPSPSASPRRAGRARRPSGRARASAAGRRSPGGSR